MGHVAGCALTGRLFVVSSSYHRRPSGACSSEGGAAVRHGALRRLPGKEEVIVMLIELLAGVVGY